MSLAQLDDAQRKAWATVQARAVLQGITAVLIEADDGRPQLICSKWHLTRAFDAPGEVESWLARVTGQAA
jgi:hypothetical protein